jgi:hypothetical protein
MELGRIVTICTLEKLRKTKKKRKFPMNIYRRVYWEEEGLLTVFEKGFLCSHGNIGDIKDASGRIPS